LPFIVLGLLIGSYLLGSIPNGYIICKLKKVDLRKIGSGNIGATNVYRALGFKWAALAGLLDVLKGVLPTLLAVQILESEILFLVVGMAAVAGHNWSVFMGFKGGRGVATTGGVVLVLMPWISLFVVIIWAVIVKLTRYVSLGSISAAVVFPILAGIFAPLPYFIFTVILAAGIIFQHKPNIKRLLAGKENRV